MTPAEALDRIAALCDDAESGRYPTLPARPFVKTVRKVLADVTPETGDVRDRHHGHPYEVIIPCMTLDEANEEKADLHVAAEARAFIRPPVAGVTLTPEEAALARGVIEETFVAEYERDRLRALHELAVRLGADLPPFEEEEDDE